MYRRDDILEPLPRRSLADGVCARAARESVSSGGAERDDRRSEAADEELAEREASDRGVGHVSGSSGIRVCSNRPRALTVQRHWSCANASVVAVSDTIDPPRCHCHPSMCRERGAIKSLASKTHLSMFLPGVRIAPQHPLCASPSPCH